MVNRKYLEEEPRANSQRFQNLPNGGLDLESGADRLGHTRRELANLRDMGRDFRRNSQEPGNLPYWGLRASGAPRFAASQGNSRDFPNSRGDEGGRPYVAQIAPQMESSQFSQHLSHLHGNGGRNSGNPSSGHSSINVANNFGSFNPYTTHNELGAKENAGASNHARLIGGANIFSDGSQAGTSSRNRYSEKPDMENHHLTGLLFNIMFAAGTEYSAGPGFQHPSFSSNNRSDISQPSFQLNMSLHGLPVTGAVDPSSLPAHKFAPQDDKPVQETRQEPVPGDFLLQSYFTAEDRISELASIATQSKPRRQRLRPTRRWGFNLKLRILLGSIKRSPC